MVSWHSVLLVGVSVTVFGCALRSFPGAFKLFVKSAAAAASQLEALEVDPLAFFVDDSDDCCERIGSSPEPRVVLYNRIPKAGSSTMQHLLRLNNQMSHFLFRWGNFGETP